MFSENSSGVMSNDLQPTESGIHGVNGQISQIPGLSPSINSLPEEKARGRRVGVLETDSDYVKLAKQGGHKGLLWHDETVTAKTNSYKPPDWFYNASGDNVEPRGFHQGTIRIMIQRTPDERLLHSLINSKEMKSPGAFKPLEPPFGTDNMSAWERDDSSSSSNGKEKNNNVRDSQMGDNVQLPSQCHHTSKFRRIVFDKKPAPVSMSKLLSFGYADDDKPVGNTDLSN